MKPSDPRDKPFFIEDTCPDCSTVLVLRDLYEYPQTPPDEVFYDEWWCTLCNDGIIMDWPQDQLDALHERMDAICGEGEATLVSLDEADLGVSEDEIREALGLDDDVKIVIDPQAMQRNKPRGDC